MKQRKMAKGKGGEGSGRGSVSLDLPNEFVYHVKVAHGKNEIDHAEVKHGTRDAATLSWIGELLKILFPLFPPVQPWYSI